MKANELMIGDYLKTIFTQKIVKVKEIKQSCIYTEDNGYEYNKIEPIPLTPDILEKIGFERCVNSISRISVSSIPICESNQFANKEFGGNTRIIDMGTHGFTLLTDVFGMTNKNKMNHLFSLHELQNALRQCGIEKEIIL